MSLAHGNNTPTRPRIEPGSPDPESDALSMKTCYFSVIYFFIILNMEFAEKLTLIHFALILHGLKMADPTLKILIVAKEKSLPWKYMA